MDRVGFMGIDREPWTAAREQGGEIGDFHRWYERHPGVGWNRGNWDAHGACLVIGCSRGNPHDGP